MARNVQGRGKSAFREFGKDLRATAKDLIASHLSGFTLSPSDISNMFDLIFSNYVRDIFDENDPLPNPQIWIVRGERKTASVESEVLSKLSLSPRIPFVLPDTLEFEIQREEDDDGTILSFPVITEGSLPRFAKAGLSVRKRLIPEDELEEYVSQVPYIIGIEIVRENGKVKGFRIWVQN
jgi:hypothetical protein